ncbi:hypothetical protein PSTG_10821 [Puccinia striiformis f. sp. tritici PST-78]|uniref:Uncharacterized protein n=1 Tax=Puccinia striiformis f. sp. tritici PST-78 TaxID=1165861 RepID=A0A0L0VA94_9BASI|nr:hypothetical protein PSTG_10821 [Puccinia striiformis f. sp. tritici PST-78]
MFAVQDTSRGMINILFIGMLTTLAINFANAYTCWNAFQTKKGGWNEGDDRASCNNGVDNYSCSLSQCGGLSAPKIFTQCSTQSGHTGDLHVYALSYTTFRNKFYVTGRIFPSTSGPPISLYCPVSQNKGNLYICQDDGCIDPSSKSGKHKQD